MYLSTMLRTYKVNLRYIPNQKAKFLYLRPDKVPDTLLLLTSIAELHDIKDATALLLNNKNFIVLFNDHAEVFPVAQISNLDSVCRELEPDGHLSISIPLLFLEEYTDENYRLSYSEQLIKHPVLLDYISIQDVPTSELSI